MNEMNPWEKQLQSWTPRRPSAKGTARLFGGVEKAPELLRRSELWSWLTPVAVCCVATMIALGGAGYHSAHFEESDDAALVSTVMLAGGSSNLQPSLPYGQLDQNMQWNIWDRISAARVTNLSQGSQRNSIGTDGWRMAATNR
jgi:hypothetical protein